MPPVTSEHLQVVAETASDAIITIDRHSIILYVNPAAERIFGYSRDELLRQKLTMLMPEYLRHLHEAAVERYLETGQRHIDWVSTELPGLHKSGRQLSLEVSFGESAQGDDRLFSGIIRDISERKRSEGRWAAQYAVAEVLLSSETLESATPAILKTLCESFGWEVGALWLVDDGGRRLGAVDVWVAPTLSVPEFERATREGSFDYGVGLPGRVWKTLEPLWIDDVTAEPGYHRAALASTEAIRSAFGFPLSIGGEFVGMMEFYCRDGSAPDPTIHNMLGTTGAQIGQFIRRKRAETELEAERDFLETILDTLTEGIVVTDKQGRLTRFNRAARDLHAFPDQTVTADAWAEHFHLYRADGTTRMHTREVPLYRALEGEVVRNAEMAIAPEGRSPRFLVANGHPLHDATGALLGAVVAMHDITDRKRSEDALRFLAEAGRKLSSSLDYATTLDTVAKLVVPAIADWCLIDLIDDDGTLQQVALVHLDADQEGLGRELRRRYPPSPSMHRGLFHVIETGRAELNTCITLEDLKSVAVDDEHLELLQRIGMRSSIVAPLTLRDRAIGAITVLAAESGREYSQADLELVEELARRAAIAVENARLFRQVQKASEELERRVLERTAQLEITNKELEAFAYSVSHDLRAPLRGIDGFSQVLIDDFGAGLDDTALGYLDRIRAGAAKMGELIDGLLVLSRVTRSEVQRGPVDLSSIVSTLGDELRSHNPERQLELRVADDLSADGDEKLLRILFGNLLENAWKFTLERPVAVIEVGVRDLAGARVFFVRDNGAGFDMDYAHKLFTPFQRLHTAEEFEGTGIGLATVQRIVRLHGGHIRAEGVVGGGASFFFTLSPGTLQLKTLSLGTELPDAR